ncbi:MAG: hypothetical protein EPN56_03735 [Rhodanobacter sp.]|nr:MAG: hypothetical protein EPN78_08510 [Rhodanobacter sp.]TAM08762.1 MAG: hypothetical protein EPN66_11825 [Rhodanobacter sp.]TAM36804.1 MAG: hypothetical protein EPN56_03735 [Rhodanobacter sp.]
MLRRPLKRLVACRRHAQRRLLTGLAFAAMLLLMVMPTTGRLLGVLGAGNYGMPHAMTVSGHAAMTAAMAMPDQPAAVALADHVGHPLPPGGNGPHPDNGTCPYCPLLASMLALALYVALLAIAPAHRPTCATRHFDFAAGLHRGLGARGPPALL